MKLNVYAQLDRLRGDVGHWRNLPVSLMGHAVLFKMMALAQLIYVLQNVPFPVLEFFLGAIESELRTLLWGGGCPRIALKKLQRGVYEGGLAVPDIRLYYWATQLINVNGWVYAPLEEPAYRVDRIMFGEGTYLSALNQKGKLKRTLPPQTESVVVICRRQPNC